MRDAAGGQLLRELGGTEGQILLAMAPTGKYVAGAGTDGVIRLWDTATGAAVRRFTLPTAWLKDEPQAAAVFRLNFSPDGRTLLAAGVQDAGCSARYTIASGRSPAAACVPRGRTTSAWN